MLKPTKAFQLYGRGGLSNEANGARRKLSIQGVGALDMRSQKPDGSNWNFKKRENKQMAMELIDKLQPTFVIRSPPCTPFSQLQGLNKGRRKPEVIQKELREGRAHIRFCMEYGQCGTTRMSTRLGRQRGNCQR